MKNAIAIAIFVVIICLLMAMFLGLFDNHVKIACGIAGLAPLPPNAKIIRSGGWSTVFSNKSCFVFKSTRKEIDEWISNSPTLKDNKPDILTENHQLISFDSLDEKRKWEQKHPDFMLIDTLNGYKFYKKMQENIRELEKMPEFLPSEFHYYNVPNDPSWFKPNISDGRLFDIPVYYCGVFIDDANDVVWVTASRS